MSKRTRVPFRKRFKHHKRHSVKYTTPDSEEVDTHVDTTSTALPSPPLNGLDVLDLNDNDSGAPSVSSTFSSVTLDHCYSSLINRSENGSVQRPNSSIADDVFTPSVLESGELNQLLLDLKQKVDCFLPCYWISFLDPQRLGLHVMLLSRQNKKSIQRCLYFSVTGEVELSVHCNKVEVYEYLKDCNPLVPLNNESVNYFVDCVAQIVNKIRLLEVCSGADHTEFREVWKNCPMGTVDNNPYQECRYSRTFRSLSCTRLVESHKWRCAECSKVISPLRRRLHTFQLQEQHPHTANKYMSEEQLLKKLKKQKKELDNAHRRIERLQEKMTKLIQSEGVDIDENASEDFMEILRTSNITPAQSLFLQQQIKASQCKKKCGMRWHPTLIRFALAVYSNSPSTYQLLQDTGMMQLPSSRTLFDYSHFASSTEGIDTIVLESVAKRTDKLAHKYQKYFVLMADEMYISKNLVYQKSSGDLIGFVSLNEVDSELRALEKFLDEGKDVTMPFEEASRVMMFMVKGVSNSIKEVVATYAVHSISPKQMYKWTWDVICALEASSVKVVAFVCDGSPTNRAFIKLHTPATPTLSGVIFDTINKAAPHRKLFFISDVTHLLKTLRNCFYKSRLGNKGKRCMRKNGQKIVWDYIIRLYKSQKSKNLRKSYKLNPQNVFPDSYSCMKVKFAAQVISRTVAQDIQDQKWHGTREVVNFIRTFNDWFDYLNGAHSTQGARTNNPRLSPYTSIDDERFEKLQDILKYLKEWEDQVNSANNDTANVSQLTDVDVADDTLQDLYGDWEDDEEHPAGKKIPSRQTLVGIEMSTRSFIEVTKFLLAEGTRFINARIFCQDPLEHRFSLQRGGRGGSTHPNVQQVLSKNRALHVQAELGIKRRKGNTQIDAAIEITEEPLRKRKPQIN